MIEHTTRLLEPGEYWVGDLCYVLDERIGFDWGEFCHFMFDGDPSGRQHEGPITYKGIDLSFHGTAHGDGYYTDQYGKAYGVDAGMIGCVAVKDIDLEKTQEGHCHDCCGGHIHNFPEPFDTDYDNQTGVIRIGHLRIPTG